MVCGHSPTKAIDYRIAYPHPVFGDAVASIDTGISQVFGGCPSALEIVGGVPLSRYLERGDSTLGLNRWRRKRTAEYLEALARS